MDLLRTVARPLLAAPFILDGLDAMARPAGHVEKIRRVTPTLERLGLPPVLDSDAAMLTRVSGAVAVAAGIGLATGHAPRTCAATLAALSVPLAVVNNPIWLASDRAERTTRATGLLRSLAVGAGVAVAALDRSGKPSLAWRRQQARAAKAAAAATSSARSGAARA